jgi:ATP-dependent Clp protease ATP-binding subunit ClpA
VEDYEDKINETLTENDAAKHGSKVANEEARVARLEADRLQTELEFAQGKAVGLQTALEVANEQVRTAEEMLAGLHGESDVNWNPSVLRHFQKEYDARVVGHLDVETMLASCIQPI